MFSWTIRWHPLFSCRSTPNVRIKSSKLCFLWTPPTKFGSTTDVKFTRTDVKSQFSSIFPWKKSIIFHDFLAFSHIFPWKKSPLNSPPRGVHRGWVPPAMSSAFRPAGFPLGRSALGRRSTKQAVRSRDLLKIYRTYDDLWENLGNIWWYMDVYPLLN